MVYCWVSSSLSLGHLSVLVSRLSVSLSAYFCDRIGVDLIFVSTRPRPRPLVHRPSSIYRFLSGVIKMLD